MPVEVREQLFKKIAPRDFEFIPVDVFQSGLLACLILGGELLKVGLCLAYFKGNDQKMSCIPNIFCTCDVSAQC